MPALTRATATLKSMGELSVLICATAFNFGQAPSLIVSIEPAMLSAFIIERLGRLC